MLSLVSDTWYVLLLMMLRMMVNIMVMSYDGDCKLPNYKDNFSPYFTHEYITYITMGI